MGDLKKLDSLTEFQLTNAIQKAASAALASEDDRSEILAKQLSADGIPKHLDKLATQGFNRRLSVITIGRRGEDTKADDFPLADFNKVASLRGHQTDMKKSASVNAPFVFTVQKAPEMKKTASFSLPEVPKYQVTPSKALQNLENCLHKEEAAFQNRLNDFLDEQAQLERMVKKASEMLRKDTRTGNLLATVYGDTYTKLFTGKIPEQALKKHAAYAVLPANTTVEYVEKTIQQADRVNVKRDLLMLKKASLERMVKETTVVQGKLKQAMLQKTEAAGYNMLKDIAANAVSVPVNAAISGLKGAAEQTDSIVGKASPFLSAQKSYSPQDIIDLDLLSTDRYQDKRMRLIDMLASPQLAQYPAREIEKAVEDTIATNPDLATPRMREYLKAEVNARLLAGNRTNRADLAAAADIAKKVVEADKNRADTLPEAAVEGLAEKRTSGDTLAGIAPSFKELLSRISNKELPVANIGQSWKALLGQVAEDRTKEEDLNEKINAENSKALENYAKRRNAAINALTKKPLNTSVLTKFKSSLSPAEQKALFDAQGNLKRKPDQLSPDQIAMLRNFQRQYFDTLAPAVQNALMDIGDLGGGSGNSSGKGKSKNNKGNKQKGQQQNQQNQQNNNKQKGTP